MPAAEALIVDGHDVVVLISSKYKHLAVQNGIPILVYETTEDSDFHYTLAKHAKAHRSFTDGQDYEKLSKVMKAMFEILCGKHLAILISWIS